AWLALAGRVSGWGAPHSGRRWGYRALLGALCAALGWAGHDGATLTHGEDYLTEHLPWRAASPLVRLSLPLDQPAKDWEAYAHVVAPILEVRCYSCHNSRNYKGRLVLDRWESLMQGGTTGPLLVAG